MAATTAAAVAVSCGNGGGAARAEAGGTIAIDGFAVDVRPRSTFVEC
jgi:hypothetical protein